MRRIPVTLLACATLAILASTSAMAKPNIVVIFCDDMGYGDLGAFGHPTIQTPNLDRMASEGQKWTSFYVAAPVCTPSRAGLMTGRLPIRSGMCHDTRRVLFPNSSGGIPAEEVTIPELLKTQGYATACVGKWHLGHLPQYLPTRNGFDYYYGIPYSNDMDRDQNVPHAQAFGSPTSEYFNVPLMRNEEIIERPADQTTITKRYTEEAVAYIKANKDKPFFLYLAHNLPHIPLFRSSEFEGKSKRGLYGDVIEEIDWSVGQVLDTLRAEGIAENTLVLFTSDNGPWLTYKQQGGSAGLLRGGKGGTYEGGMRVPAIFWQPGTIAPGVVTDMGSSLDLLATAGALAGATLPSDRVLDSFDLSPVLRGTGPSPRATMFYYRDTTVYAVRQGPFKAHFQTRNDYGDATVTTHNPPLLYNVEIDPGEQFDVAAEHPDVIASIQATLAVHNRDLVRGADQMGGKIENGS
ncbi:MAG: sulfatase [Candidatus Hydrogenedentes bacterium]|nr:sulfatase [Candidatus Hydrogenedentota bacterium]